MKAGTVERIWIWSARLAPCLGLLVFVAFGWESLPPWYAPSHRVWRLEHGPAPLETFVDRDEDEPQEATLADRRTTAAALDRSADEGSAIDLIDAPHDAVVHETTEAAADRTLFWLNLRSGVRHNAECRYFDPTGEGRYCGAGEGRACRICGG
jgi:hypothetical protein